MQLSAPETLARAESSRTERSWVEQVRRAPLARRIRGRQGHWLAGATVLGGTWAMVAETRHELPTWERPVFEALNQLPDALGPAVWPVMQLGSFWVWAVAAPAGSAVFRRREPALSWTGATVLAWGLAKVIKERAGRGRPGDIFDGVHVRERGITGLGFVSGHAAIAFALATAATPYLPPERRALPFLAGAAVGLSRLYVGAHLPLDVIGGAALGVLCGLTASLAVGTPDIGRG